ncbi:ornithine-acyl-ACP acyltransferase [Phaeobacter gallaeciensis]|uniref:L-ornithine N(alpha)-acyltransferase n=1 Tax=Phaeobacter gallaeciensis TaxID=60890 RepID=A0A1B0ZWX0_9RHOB|nr:MULTISPECIES: GNAT family N-acyltransferase [Phaeobacter]MEE2633048.1 GNAT family N-acyltransferase [Pseudomonadota bacterium]ANP38618.1 ornithine-acyl-ACP acyltransferase [Phaeobacter gallaeciensis]MDE4062240.1 GNAT family N-acetyltransferase [Phaeobacter gallaeciensis]MDE4125143.1 GNAT family N-acetyltransferase [Phaeobacter gallaeciensis]MDE4129717.1 GNAT family N-acetyltransferase [Phaeobacter gallaeciensis]
MAQSATLLTETLLSKGRYLARFAGTDADLHAAQELRSQCFGTVKPDRDPYDSRCRHILIEERDTRALIGCFRMLTLESGQDIPQSYAAQYYDLSRLSSYEGRMAEVGRFCIREGAADADILRIAWGAITALVDAEDIRMLFGCSSFAGTEAAPYLDTFALLRQRHLAPGMWQPVIKAPQVVRFDSLPARVPDQKVALRHMPPLLRTYLLMGGWVSDHAVVDEGLNTLHVFTGVDVGAIPETRKRLLRAVAAPV